MATPVLNPKLTKVGLALVPNNAGTGFAITLTHIGVGTALYTPDGTEVALKNEVARYPIGGGTKPTATSIQTGVTITDTDPNGNSPNGASIGEIGWYSNTTLVAVWSRATGGALFVKSAGFDVPFAYTLDVSAFPEGNVTVTVGTDPQGMAALILQHKAEPDPHTQYVQKVRGLGDYVSTTVYGIGAKVTGPDNKTYRSLVAGNIGNTPATSPTKWERWGHSVAEMDVEFVPKRTAVQMGTADTTGVLRVSNPGGAALAAPGTGMGCIRVAFPPNSQTKDTYVRLRMDVFDGNDRKAFTVLLNGHVSTGLAWDGCEAAILGQLAANDLTVRFGNDGTKPCILVGETNTAWKNLRAVVTEVMISNNSDGGDAVLWAANWTMGLVTAVGAVSVTLLPNTSGASNLVFGQTDVNHVAGLADILATKQGGLGFTPVQQGGGPLQLANKVNIGWDGGGLRASADGIDQGRIAMLTSPNFNGVPTAPTISDWGASGLQIANATFVQAAISNALVGAIIMEARKVSRANWLICAGYELNRADYPALWNYAQSSGNVVSQSDWNNGYWGCFSTGNGTTTFNIPCLTGEFPRFWDNGRGADPGRVLGQFQATQNAAHNHGGNLYTSFNGNHYHVGTTDPNGSHAHDGITTTIGDHQHVIPYGENEGYPWGTWATGQVGSHGGLDNDNAWPFDSPSGTHAHSLLVNANGVHQHSFTTGYSVQGDHQHYTIIPTDGGIEGRPRNISLTPMIRFA